MIEKQPKIYKAIYKLKANSWKKDKDSELRTHSNNTETIPKSIYKK